MRLHSPPLLTSSTCTADEDKPFSQTNTSTSLNTASLHTRVERVLTTTNKAKVPSAHLMALGGWDRVARSSQEAGLHTVTTSWKLTASREPSAEKQQQ